eukprot:4295283-Prymnesium_polylepis.1
MNATNGTEPSIACGSPPSETGSSARASGRSGSWTIAASRRPVPSRPRKSMRAPSTHAGTLS